MKAFVSFLLSVVVWYGFLGNVNSMNVSIYYEALCYDSIQFIVRQLYPHYEQIADHIHLEFVPYGKAMFTQNDDGTFNFTCQHGAAECQANKYQSCVLAQNNGQRKDVQFVNCIMRQRNRHMFTTVETCARRNNLDVPSIRKCSEGLEGDRLLAANGDKTDNIFGQISFVPTIVFDGKYNDETQNQSLIDFVAVVCSKIEGDKPIICRNRPLPEKMVW
ncbi:hypothetical protein JTB14_029991 [Gonioctena quinquepunctata]|nr:hypothetical protein JTB14_029991 [Gonioctena quinquepunctata]